MEAGTKEGIGPSHSPPSNRVYTGARECAEIKEFAAGYNVKFDLFSKICVNGDDAHPLWKWMKVQPKGRGMLGKIELGAGRLGRMGWLPQGGGGGSATAKGFLTASCFFVAPSNGTSPR